MLTLINRIFNRSAPVEPPRIQLGGLVKYGNEFCRIIGVGEFSVTLLNDEFQKFENVPNFAIKLL